MKTTFRVKQPYADQFLDIAQKTPCDSPARPVNFIRKMQMDQGSVGVLSGFGLDENGLERKNPVVVALGDSVTAGHFENLISFEPDAMKEGYVESANRMRLLESRSAQEVEAAFVRGELGQIPPVEVTDARQSYLEKFRGMLIDKYERTSVSAINAGIAGDHLISMIARADRDVIRYQPDLVLINGVLNWGPPLGTTAEYKAHLTGLVEKIKAETTADIILLTSNGDLPNPMYGQPREGERTEDRVKTVREVAREQSVCLADVYAVWERARGAGIPWKELLANGINHPSVEGHEVYAITLMKLFEQETAGKESLN